MPETSYYPRRKIIKYTVFALTTETDRPEQIGRSRSALRKQAYSNILKILPPKSENFQIKNSDIFHISAQNIYNGYSLELPQRGGSNASNNLCF